MESLLKAMLEEQRKTNELLALLIQALAEEPEEADDQPARYMNGTPIGVGRG